VHVKDEEMTPIQYLIDEGVLSQMCLTYIFSLTFVILSSAPRRSCGDIFFMIEDCSRN
jgi:hypothetical protein